MSCFVINVDFDDLYMVLSLAIWMFICYFVYRHESVIDELTDSDAGPIGDGLDDGNVAQGGGDSAAAFRRGEDLSQS